MASASASRRRRRPLMFQSFPKPGANRPQKGDKVCTETLIQWHAQARERAVERDRESSALCSSMQLSAGTVDSMAIVLSNAQIGDKAMAGIGSHMDRGTQAARKGRPVGETEIGTNRLTDGTILGLPRVLPHHPAGLLRRPLNLAAIQFQNQQLLECLASSRRSTLRSMERRTPRERTLTERSSSNPGR